MSSTRTTRCALTFAAAAVAAALVAAPATAIQAGADSSALPSFDIRTGDRADVPSATERARLRIATRLGAEGIVSSDKRTGGVRMLGATDSLLSDPADGGAKDLALAYVADHASVFGLDSADIAALQLAARYTSPDGITHLTWEQTDRAVPSYDTFLSVNVARDGAIVNVTGSPVHDLGVPSVEPALSRAEGSDAAVEAAGGQGKADGGKPVIVAGPDGDRLGRRFTVWANDGNAYDVVVDADTGELLVRELLTAHVSNASVFLNHPGAAAGGTATTFDLAADPFWLNDTAGNTRLRGRNAYVYADVNGNHVVDSGEEIPASSGSDWVYPQTAVACAGGQSPSVFTGICTWDGVNRAATEPINRNQATTQLAFLVNNFHDWLAQPPIGFTDASHNFEVGGTGGSDPVIAEANTIGATNNADMSAPVDGASPTMRLGLFTSPFPALNSSDDGSVVYHEYTHGLSNRLVNNGLGGGLFGHQSQSMGEGWSDWYAMDYLVGHGLVTDTAAAGEVAEAEYVTNNINTGLRTNALDCAVGASGPGCPGTPTAGGAGGYTYGDLGHVLASGAEEHADGEIWVETLWDLRDAIGVTAARGLITNAMRLSPLGPSFLDMRDAILMADTAAGGADRAEIWQVFANRGMGFSAATNGSGTTGIEEAFDLPPPVVGAGKLGIQDPPPLGDGDSRAEPGETVRLAIPLRNAGATALTGSAGALGSTAAFVGEPRVDYGTIPGDKVVTPTGRYAVTVPTGASCGTSLPFALAFTSVQAGATVPVNLPVGPVCATSVTPPLAATAAASEVAMGGATLNGTLNPVGVSTQYAFEHGPTASYGARTPAYSGGSGSATLPQSTPIDGLLPDSDHHFRLVALRAGVVVAAGADQTLHTTGPPPETTIDGGPVKLRRGRNATFSFSSNRAGASFECSVDGNAFAPCTSPHTVSKPRRGKHTFTVRARSDGLVDPTPAAGTFEVTKKKRKKKRRR